MEKCQWEIIYVFLLTLKTCCVLFVKSKTLSLYNIFDLTLNDKMNTIDEISCCSKWSHPSQILSIIIEKINQTKLSKQQESKSQEDAEVVFQLFQNTNLSDSCIVKRHKWIPYSPDGLYNMSLIYFALWSWGVT